MTDYREGVYPLRGSKYWLAIKEHRPGPDRKDWTMWRRTCDSEQEAYEALENWPHGMLKTRLLSETKAHSEMVK